MQIKGSRDVRLVNGPFVQRHCGHSDGRTDGRWKPSFQSGRQNIAAKKKYDVEHAMRNYLRAKETLIFHSLPSYVTKSISMASKNSSGKKRFRSVSAHRKLGQGKKVRCVQKIHKETAQTFGHAYKMVVCVAHSLTLRWEKLGKCPQARKKGERRTDGRTL